MECGARCGNGGYGSGGEHEGVFGMKKSVFY